jgi:hypothetical protein
MEQRCCVGCGAPLPEQLRGRPRKYCAICRPSKQLKPAAYATAYARARRSPKESARCEQCGGLFVKPRTDSRHCSRRCYYRSKPHAVKRLTTINSTKVECVVCGKHFRKRNDNIRRWPKHCCSNDCKAFSKRTELTCDLRWVSCLSCKETWLVRDRGIKCEACHPPPPPTVAAGPVCHLARGRSDGMLTPTRHRPRLFISGRCKGCGDSFLDHGKGQHPNRYLYCLGCKPRRWRKDLDRARQYGVAYEPIDRRKVFRRDGYRCGLCGEQTDPDAPLNSPRAPTLDHIVPVSRGGPHLYSNVQCACFECNWRKADGTDAEWRHAEETRVGGHLLSTTPEHTATGCPVEKAVYEIGRVDARPFEATEIERGP